MISCNNYSLLQYFIAIIHNIGLINSRLVLGHHLLYQSLFSSTTQGITCICRHTGIGYKNNSIHRNCIKYNYDVFSYFLNWKYYSDTWSFVTTGREFRAPDYSRWLLFNSSLHKNLFYSISHLIAFRWVVQSPPLTCLLYQEILDTP